MSAFVECVVGIGSNIDADKNIASAMEIIRQDYEIVAVSTFLQTSPIGITNQPKFHNGAIKILVNKDFEVFNSFLKSVEMQLKRDRKLPHFGPRTIDLDIIVWDGEIVDNDYFTRDFLKKSVDEIL